MGWDKVGEWEKACGFPHAYDDVLLLWEGSRNPQGCEIFLLLCFLRPYACACEYVQVSMHGPWLFFLPFTYCIIKKGMKGGPKGKEKGKEGKGGKATKLENHLIRLLQD